ncbi:response regulator [Methyloversatilis sp.]|uniref:response regulator n=1 Tax=Methyloversatilis sp. TaxID=2569862 RepID=UPI0035B45092
MSVPTSPPRRALLIEDHEIVINAVAACLRVQGLVSECEKVSSLAEAETLLVGGEQFALVILDLHLADARGLDALQLLSERWPSLPKLVYSGDDAIDTMARAFELGALGFVAKNEPTAELSAAVATVLSGRPHLPIKLLTASGLVNLPPTGPATRIPSPPAQSSVRLTPRQLEVVAMVATALPNKVIADRLSLSEGTVKSHLNTIFRIVGARNRMELLLRVRELGIELPEVAERPRRAPARFS